MWFVALALVIALSLGYLPLLLTPEGPVVDALRGLARSLPSRDEAAVEAPSRARLAAAFLWDAYDAGDVHVVMFVLLGWAVGYVRRAPGLGAPAALVGLAVAGEAIQQFSIDRILTAEDVVQNLAGALVGLATARAAQLRQR